MTTQKMFFVETYRWYS